MPNYLTPSETLAANILDNVDSTVTKKKKVYEDPLKMGTLLLRAVRKAGVKGPVALSFLKKIWKLWLQVERAELDIYQAVMQLDTRDYL